jgi:phospholipid-translocating ATPase
MILGYSTLYTAFPVISLLYDKDTDLVNVLKFPTLYKQMQKGKELSIKKILWIFWKSLFQASIIMIGSILLFEKSFLKIATITFTILIFAELLNVYSEIKTFHVIMVFSLIFTFFTYIFSLVFLKEIIDFAYLTIENVLKIVLLSFVSWIPFFMLKKIRKCIYPEAYEKLNIIKVKNNS